VFFTSNLCDKLSSQTALLLLNRLTDSKAMDVSDVYFKLREQILLYNNSESDLERTGGLSLINTTNLSFFDSAQKSELFRLKAIFLASLRRTSKSNQAYSHSVQISPSHTESWISWGGLCSSLGAMTEKQAEQAKTSGAPDNTIESRGASTKKVAQYLAQAMGCYLEAVQIDPNEKSRMHLPKCLWMLTKDGSSPGVLCQTLENRGTKLPAWVWLPWVPQLLTGLCRLEGRVMKALLARVVKAYPQAAYYSLRAFYLERRDVERARGGGAGGGAQLANHMGSVAFAEEMMSTLRKSHAALWSSLEAVLEELIVRFRPSYEEELLATISALLERAESHAEKQSLPDKKRMEDENAMVASWSKTLSRIAAKFFKETDTSSSTSRRDERIRRTAEFKAKYKTQFERDFKVAAGDGPQGLSTGDPGPQFRLAQYIDKLQLWKEKLESQVARTPGSVPLIESSQARPLARLVRYTLLWRGGKDPRG
jgi:transformation/transcription domain-associated protein